MTRSKKPLELIIQAIRESLEEIKQQGGSYAVAMWPEADGGGGYMLHVDGRMMDADDYQRGFSNIDELLEAGLSDDVHLARTARSEAGSIASTIHGVSEDKELYEYLSDTLPHNFGVEYALVDKKMSSGMTPEQCFELYWSKPTDALTMFESSGYPRADECVLAKDITVASLIEDQDGSLHWISNTMFRKGHTVRAVGLAEGGRQVEVPGGSVMMRVKDFSSITPAPAPAHRVHP